MAAFFTKRLISLHLFVITRQYSTPQKLFSSSIMTTRTVRELYPEIEPYDSGHLSVSDVHKVYFEQCGNPKGKPIIFLHGGPGGGCGADVRRFFDPVAYRIILMDQRGAGKSTPSAELKDNTTWHLVSDIEKLRCHLEIENWVVFGGSWGSTLALVYAEQHPDRVKALVLRGIFTLRRKEIEWYYQYGASVLFPDKFEEYVKPIPVGERNDLVSAYYRYLTGTDEAKQLECAKAWSGWEMATSRIQEDPKLLSKIESDVWSLQFARIECHYFVHGGFFESDSHLLDNLDKIRHIPATVVQGRYDVVCPMMTAWELHKRWPEADFHIIPDAGHSAKEDGIRTELLNATDKYKTL